MSVVILILIQIPFCQQALANPRPLVVGLFLAAAIVLGLTSQRSLQALISTFRSQGFSMDTLLTLFHGA